MGKTGKTILTFHDKNFNKHVTNLCPKNMYNTYTEIVCEKHICAMVSYSTSADK